MPLPVSIRDAFQRANENPASYWTNIPHFSSVAHTIVSQTCKAAAGSSPFDSYFTGLVPAANCAVYAKFLTKGPNQWVTLHVANPGTTTTDGYYIETVDNGGAGNDDLNIQRFDNSANTPIATRKLTFNAGDEIGATWLNGVITAFINGVALLSVSDATYQAAGFVGCGGVSNAGNTAPTIAYFGAGSYPAAMKRGLYRPRPFCPGDVRTSLRRMQ